MRIEGKDIILTGITYEDTEDIVKWRNTEFVRNRFIYQKKFTAEGHEKWMKTMVETGKVVQFIIWERFSEKKIGSVYLRDIDRDNRKAEFGIFIGEEDFLGKGYGKEAANLITRYAFDELKLGKVFLRLLSDNKRAYQSYLGSGFVEEGVFKQDVVIDGQAKDVIFMAKYAE